MKHFALKKTFISSTLIFSFLSATCISLNQIASQNYQRISDFFNQPTFKGVYDSNKPGESSIYFDSKYNSVNEILTEGQKINEELVNEGTVLLKNDKETLPLLMAAPKISLFSINVVNPLYSTNDTIYKDQEITSFIEAFKEKGFIVNEELYNFYLSKLNNYQRNPNEENLTSSSIKEISWDNLPASKLTQSDLAIYVITRSPSKFNNIPFVNNGNSNYLALTKEEQSVLQGIKENTGIGKAFRHSMVILNTANPIEMSFLDEYDIDSCLYIPTLGTNGTKSIVEIINGEVNPSAKLTTTLWNKHYLNPVYSNYTPNQVLGSNEGENLYSLIYQENIYNGYRYAETRYEDEILSTNSDPTFNYDDMIKYPFGYGESYTSFCYSNFKLENYNADKDEYTFKVDVKNIGTVPGKEVVQFYIQKPYTNYDKLNNIEKSSIELIDFAKTKSLVPNESQTIEFIINRKTLATYDAYNTHSYILEKGKYYFTIGTDSHNAINNVIYFKKANIMQNINQFSNLTTFINIENNDFKKYNLDETTKNKITNQFDNVDLKIYELESINKDSFIYTTRKDWTNSSKLGFDEAYNNLNNDSKVILTPILKNEFMNKYSIEKDKRVYPTFGNNITQYSLIDLRVDEKGNPIAFDDPKWDTLLNQISYREMNNILTCGFNTTLGIASINKPSTIDNEGFINLSTTFDGCSGTNRGFAVSTNDPLRYRHPIIYTSAVTIGQTFNKALGKKLGEHIGEECLWAGVSGIYSPNLSVSRGAFAKINNNYFSEDPIVCGKIGANLIEGEQAKGVYVYMKTPISNEFDKIGIFTNEQTIRELYLKPYEICIKEGGAKCFALSSNRLGAKNASQQGFVNTVLRNEFGMEGFAIDNFSGNINSIVPSCLNGVALSRNDLLGKYIYNPYKENYGKVAKTMRKEVHKILYTVCQSNAMNGISSNTTFVNVTPKWKLILDAGSMTSYLLCALSIVGLGYIYLIEYLTNRNNKNKGETK